MNHILVFSKVVTVEQIPKPQHRER